MRPGGRPQGRTRLETVKVGSGAYSIAAGRSAKITVHLNRTGRQRLAQAPHHRLRVTATAKTAHRLVTLTPAPKPKRKTRRR